MTEEEWLTCGDPERMLEFLRDKASDRKLRLFGVACCRRIWDSLGYEVNRVGVIVAERYADGMATGEEMQRANDAIDARGDTRHSPADYLTSPDLGVVRQVAGAVAWSVAYNAPCNENGDRIPTWEHWEDGETKEQFGLLCDIFGNPFRRVNFDPAWRTSTAMALAEGMYASRDFGAMPILADALQDAGCENEDVLNHCRDTTLTHVRGCWVVDLVLGKE